LRSVPLSVLGLVASVAMAGTPYSVARDGRSDLPHHHAAGGRGNSSGGPAPGQPRAGSPYGNDRAEGAPRGWARLTLVSDGSWRDDPANVSSGDRSGHDPFGRSWAGDLSGVSGAGQPQDSRSPDSGRGASDDNGSGVGDRFPSSWLTGAAGMGGFFAPSQESRPGQTTDTAPNNGPGDDRGGGGPPSTINGGAPPVVGQQIVGPSVALVRPASSVPEPAAWMMVMVGVGALGWVLRRDRDRGALRPAGAARVEGKTEWVT